MPGNKPWSPEDEALLRTLLEAGTSAYRVAVKLKRTVPAIKARATQLGISLKREKLERILLPGIH